MTKQLNLSIFATMLLAACGSDPVAPTNDASTDTAVDAPPAVVNPPVTADVACRGIRLAPSTTEAPVPVAVNVLNFSANTAAANVRYEIFPGNDVGASCLTGAGGICEPTADCLCGTTGADGLGQPANLRNPSYYAYRVPAVATGNGTRYLTVGYSREIAGSAQAPTATLLSVPVAIADPLIAILGRTRDANRAVIAGQFFACNDQPVANARLRLFSGSTEITASPRTEASNTFIAYFQGNTPAAMRTGTDPGGLFAAGNIPVADATAGSPLRIELWGRLSEGGAEEILACEDVRIFQGGVTIISPNPLRGDYPQTSGCFGRFTPTITDGGTDAGTDSSVSDAGTDSSVSDAGTDAASDAGNDA